MTRGSLARARPNLEDQHGLLSYNGTLPLLRLDFIETLFAPRVTAPMLIDWRLPFTPSAGGADIGFLMSAIKASDPMESRPKDDTSGAVPVICQARGPPGWSSEATQFRIPNAGTQNGKTPYTKAVTSDK